MNVHFPIRLWAGRLAMAATCLMVFGCSPPGMRDLEQFIATEKAKPAAPVPPVPQIKPYETFVYGAADLRDPFTPSAEDQPTLLPEVGSGVRPDANRPREALESYPLDSLRMVGILERDQVTAALVRTQDGTIHRVNRGNYLGQNHGKITAIHEGSVDLVEIIPDSQGGWVERTASLALSE